MRQRLAASLQGRINNQSSVTVLHAIRYNITMPGYDAIVPCTHIPDKTNEKRKKEMG